MMIPFTTTTLTDDLNLVGPEEDQTSTSSTSVLQPILDATEPRASPFRTTPGTCGGCLQTVNDRYYLVAAERCWHLECLRCTACHALLESESSCYVREGLMYCRKDYYRQFATRCARCACTIELNELVMRARDLTFHMPCFTCAACGVALLPGQYFAVDQTSQRLLCQLHYEPLLDSDRRTYSSSSRKAKKKSQGSNLIDADAVLYTQNGELCRMASGSRAKRMRTSFKHHQLKAMKAYFMLNHNPDAKDLKQLAQRTGLTKRVLQVWFQNARAKYRRSLTGSSSSGCRSDQDDPAKAQQSMDSGLPGDDSGDALGRDSVDRNSLDSTDLDHYYDICSTEQIRLL